MRSFRSLLVPLALIALAVGCSGKAPGTPVPTRTATGPRTIDALPKQPDARVEIALVQGAAPGGIASVTAKTTPEAMCSIQYQVPSGLITPSDALFMHPADEQGNVSWRWVISRDSRTGAGKVRVNCNGAEATADVPIG